MNRIAATVIAAILLAIVAAAALSSERIYNAGYEAGRRHDQKLVYADAFTAASESLEYGTALTPQTREFIKAQFYYYGCHMGPGTIRKLPRVDYGPVDEKLIAGARPFFIRDDSPNTYYWQILRVYGGGKQ